MRGGEKKLLLGCQLSENEKKKTKAQDAAGVRCFREIDRSFGASAAGARRLLHAEQLIAINGDIVKIDEGFLFFFFFLSFIFIQRLKIDMRSDKLNEQGCHAATLGIWVVPRKIHFRPKFLGRSTMFFGNSMRPLM